MKLNYKRKKSKITIKSSKRRIILNDKCQALFNIVHAHKVVSSLDTVWTTNIK